MLSVTPQPNVLALTFLTDGRNAIVGAPVRELDAPLEAPAQPLVCVPYHLLHGLLVACKDHDRLIEMFWVGHQFHELVDRLLRERPAACAEASKSVRLVNEKDAPLRLEHLLIDLVLRLADVAALQIERAALDDFVGAEHAELVEDLRHCPRNRRFPRPRVPQEQVRLKVL